MKQFTKLLTISAILGFSLSSQAEERVFTYTDSEGFPVYGAAMRVSPNGRYIVGADEAEQTGSYIIDTTNPENIIQNNEGELYDVADNGMAVGSWYNKVGYAKYLEAAVYKDGTWTTLPLPQEIIGQSIARAISADGTLIAGQAMCENSAPDEPGKYFPILWKLDPATGEYVVKKLYNSLYLPGTLGFYVYDMSPDGKWVCGLHCLDFGGYISSILNTETNLLIESNEIEYKEYTFEYTDPITGEKEEMTFDAMFVDGMLDGFDGYTECTGRFLYATNDYIYGVRSIVHDVQPDFSASITNYACIYDTATGEYIDGSKQYGYACGEGLNLQFTTDARFVTDGIARSIATEFHVPSGIKVGGVYCIDRGNKVLCGSHVCTTALGEMIESPLVIMLDNSLVAEVPCEGLAFNKSEVELQLNYVMSLVANPTPANTSENVLYSSDNEAVATVDEVGIVKGLSLGTANITATCGDYTATCKVVVVKESGIETISTDIANGENAYFNLQGVRVMNPENGVFIHVENGKATKVFVK